MVYPPRNIIMCHIYLYVYLLVDHDLWSTLTRPILYVFPRIVLPIGLRVDHKLWSTLHAI